MSKTHRYSLIAILSAIAIVINLIENIFIPPLTFGIRFGLANIISLVTIYIYGSKEMLLVILLRLTLGNILKGTIFGTPFWISSSGLLLSSIAILICFKLKATPLFTSFMSSLFHTTGQVIAVCILYNQVNIMILLPTLIIFSLATGALTGLISIQVIKRIKK